MSTELASLSQQRSWQLPGWAAAVLVLLGTVVIGGALGGLARLLFVLGCGAVGWYAWRQRPGAHLQAALILFVFAPFVRRIVDLSAGYDQLGLMLIGPLLAILAPAVELDARAGWRLGEDSEVYVAVENLADAKIEVGQTADGVTSLSAPRVVRLGFAIRR